MRRVIAIALLVMAMVALLPGAAGLYLQYRYQTLLHDLSDAGYEVREGEFRLGWLTSETTTVLAPAGAGAEREARLRLVLTLEHGPRVWFGADSDTDTDTDTDASEQVRLTWPPVIATASGRSVVHGGPRALPPLRVTAAIGLLGEVRAEFGIPDVAYSGRAGRVSVVSATAEVALKGRGHWRLRGGIASLEATGEDDRRLALSGVELFLAGKGADAALPVTDLSVQVAGVTLDQSATAPALSVGGLGLQLLAQDQGTSVDLRLQAAVQSLLIDGEGYAPSRLSASLGGVDADALAALRSRLGTLDGRALAPSQRGLATSRALLMSLPELLSGSPRLRVEQCEVLTPDGTLTATADLGLSSATGAASAEPAAPQGTPEAAQAELSALLHRLAGRLEGGMQVSLSQSLLVALIAEQQAVRVRRELALRGEPNEALPPTLAAEVDAAAQSAAAMLLREGWLSARQGRLVAELRVADGELRVNDRPVAVPGWFVPPAGAR